MIRYRVFRPDHSVVVLEEMAQGFFDDQGKALRLAGIAVDVTEKAKAQESLRREREMLKAIIDAIPVMITIYDPYLRSLHGNREFSRILGWCGDDLARDDYMELCYPDPAYRREVIQFMQSVEPGWREFRVTAKDGSIVESSWANVRLPDGTQIGIGLDIRERKAVQREREEYLECLDTLVLASMDVLKARDIASLLQHVIDVARKLTGARMDYGKIANSIYTQPLFKSRFFYRLDIIIFACIVRESGALAGSRILCSLGGCCALNSCIRT